MFRNVGLWHVPARLGQAYVAWYFHNKMTCPEFSVCYRNTLGVPVAQCSSKSQFFHVNPDGPWFHWAKTRFIL